MGLKILCITLLISPLSAETGFSKGALSLFLENDVLVGTDRYYTNGLLIRWLSPEFSPASPASDGQEWLKRLACSLSPLKGKEYRQALSVAVVQKMFTSEDITIADPDPDSWPYSGTAAVEFGFQSRSPDRLDSYVFSIGIIGKHSYAGGFQTFLHRLFDFKPPMGWHHQIRDRFLLNIYYESILQQAHWEGTGSFALELFTNCGAGVGNGFIGTGGGLLLRAGWNLPRNFGPSRIRSRGEFLLRPERFGIGFYGAIDGRWALHDIILDDSLETGPNGPRRKPIYGEVSAGLEIFTGSFTIAFSGILWSRRLASQRRPHIFGSLNLSYCY